MIIADLQIHSKYSRAVSQKMDLFEIARWADLKGINLVATGDWTHPLWFRHIQETLEEDTPGIFRIKNHSFKTRFLLSTEVSSIYQQAGKLRRIHNLIFSPNLSVCEKISKELTKRGANLLSDGRPVTGIPAREILDLALTVDQNCLVIPAHIWTPWFSLFGSMSGFDSIEECFGNLSGYIYAVETGLSSDPVMNWQISELDNRMIVSFSDAHSGAKLGREATVFVFKNKNQKNYDYFDIVLALKNNPKSKLKVGFTIEFFPEEGKYHWSGHRNCQVRYSPEEIKTKGSTCPVCHKTLTIGVESRVMSLAKRIIPPNHLVLLKNNSDLIFVYDPQKKRVPFVSLVPLMEVVEKIESSKKRVEELYFKITKRVPEFDFLMKLDYQTISDLAGEKIAQAIKRIRNRQISVIPGYDGVFGQVIIFPKNNENGPSFKDNQHNQPTLF